MSQQREIDISRKGFPSRSIPEPLPIFTVNMEIAHEVPSYEGVISGSVPSSPVIRQALPIPDIPPPIYSGREAKPANTLIRWNLLFTFLILLFVSSAFWIPFIPKIQKFSMEIVVIILAFLHLLWLIAVINNFRYLFRLRKFKSHQINLSRLNTSGKIVKHLVGIAFYKEPIELMIDTLDSLASQPDARKKISVFAGMESGTPDKEEKTKKLHDLYDSKFERFIVTVHPRGLPGEIPGKCSNFNFGSRMAVAQLRGDKSYGLDKNVELLITTGDCDTIFGDRYFDALEEDYWKTNSEQRGRTVWQSPLFYCINIDKSPFFVRATGLLRSFFMMGYLIPWNINTMSVFSLTLKLFEDGEYVHPGYQMDDIIALIRWTCVVRQKCIIRAIPVATLSGPTSGKNYLEELYEWARQIRRWTIGAAEVFHYFAIKSTRLPLGVAIVWALRFIFYYGFLLCISSVYSIIAPFVTTGMLQLANHKTKGLIIPSSKVFTYINLGMLALQYFWFFLVFLINKLAEPIFPNNQKDKTGFLRNILHWILTWPTITAYCCIEVFAFIEVTFRGKKVCNHGASKKDGLVSKQPNKVAPIIEKPKIMEMV
uniref:Glycosyltransferase 2-like domain-containing protein n=1 Tax=Panagrolaimus sp. ES5 TaxID=591445 RepID=A0AC34FV28_9BILA